LDEIIVVDSDFFVAHAVIYAERSATLKKDAKSKSMETGRAAKIIIEYFIACVISTVFSYCSKT